MKRFAADDEVQLLQRQVENCLSGVVVVDSIPSLGRELDPQVDDGLRMLELAWHLRQRDTAEALELGRRAQPLLKALWRAEGAAAQSASGRWLLVQAEAAWLFGDLAEAQRLLDKSGLRFRRASCGAGKSDAAWLAASVASDRGDFALRNRLMWQSHALAEAAGDDERRDLAFLASCFFETLADPSVALRDRGQAVSAILQELGKQSAQPGVAALAHGFFFQTLCNMTGRLADVVEHGLPMVDESLRSGQLRRAIIGCNNFSAVYASLNDQGSAFEWIERATELARRAGWPQTLGLCLTGNVEVLQGTGRLDAAAACAAEAMEVLTRFPGSKNHTVAMFHLATVERARGRFQEAERHFAALLELPRTHDYADIRISAAQGLAETICERLEAPGSPQGACGQPVVHALVDAEDLAQETLSSALVTGNLPVAIDAHRVRARIARLRERSGSNDSPLEHLVAAAELVLSSPEIVPTPELFEELAEEFARQARHAEAFEAEKRVVAALRSQAVADAGSRGALLEVRLKTDRALLDAEHQRKLAAAESARARELQRVNDALEAAQALLTARNEELNAAYAEIQSLSLTDPLTGLNNRRFLTQHIDRDVLQCIRKYEAGGKSSRAWDGKPRDMLFLLADIDHFKAVNDTYGHAAGDQVLIQFKERLCLVFRETDYVVRWGGEEFLMVMKDVDREDAPAIAERLRLAVASTPFRIGADLHITKTCSIGIAAFPPKPNEPRAHTWGDAVEQADRRLYAAKRSGRNRWMVESGFQELDTVGAGGVG